VESFDLSMIDFLNAFAYPSDEPRFLPRKRFFRHGSNATGRTSKSPKSRQTFNGI
jgi:hypothetical protein